MGVRYNERTGVWEFDSVDEAKSFNAKAASAPAAAPKQQVKTGIDEDLAAQVLPVLWALGEAGTAGLLGEKLAPIAGLKGPKGMAGFAIKVKRYLSAVSGQKDVSKLFWRDKKEGSPAVWHVDVNALLSLGLLQPEEVTAASKNTEGRPRG